MLEHRTILEKLVAGKLKSPVSEDQGTDPFVFRELMEAGYVAAVDAASKDGPDYLEPRITLAGRNYLTSLIGTDVSQLSPAGLKIFLSHSSDDNVAAEALVRYLQTGLDLRRADIRCTSVDGYRLKAGANTDETLRREVHDADVLIGLISQSSLSSLYVAFELGARWGLRKPLFPVLAPGTVAEVLGGPLAGLNALDSSSKAQMEQLLADVAEILSVQIGPGSMYAAHLAALVELDAVAPSTNYQGGPVELSSEEVDSVKLKEVHARLRVSTGEAGLMTPAEIAKVLAVDEQTVVQLLESGSLQGLTVAGSWRASSSHVSEFVETESRKKQLEIFIQQIRDPKLWAEAMQAEPDLERELRTEDYAKGSMGRFLQEALRAHDATE